MLEKLYSLMVRYNFKPKNKLDQNFIINKNIINKVIDYLNIEKEDIILEIGAGTGFLTKEILKKAKKVIAIEKDKEMCDILKKDLNKKNLEIINKDILDIDLSSFNYNKIVSFLPYSISKSFIYKIIKENKKMVLIVQKEFAEKLNAIEGFFSYKAITVLTKTYYNIKTKESISQNSFFPKPNCKSTIIILEPKNKYKYDAKYNTFVKQIFRYPNKDAKKSLSLCNYKIDKSKINSSLLKRKIKQLRIEEIRKIYLAKI